MSKTLEQFRTKAEAFIQAPHKTWREGPNQFLVLPLIIKSLILLLVCTVNLQEWLQMLVMCLYILVIYINIIEILLLFKDFFCCAW